MKAHDASVPGLEAPLSKSREHDERPTRAQGDLFGKALAKAKDTARDERATSAQRQPAAPAPRPAEAPSRPAGTHARESSLHEGEAVAVALEPVDAQQTATGPEGSGVRKDIPLELPPTARSIHESVVRPQKALTVASEQLASAFDRELETASMQALPVSTEPARLAATRQVLGSRELEPVVEVAADNPAALQAVLERVASVVASIVAQPAAATGQPAPASAPIAASSVPSVPSVSSVPVAPMPQAAGVAQSGQPALGPQVPAAQSERWRDDLAATQQGGAEGPVADASAEAGGQSVAPEATETRDQPADETARSTERGVTREAPVGGAGLEPAPAVGELRAPQLAAELPTPVGATGESPTAPGGDKARPGAGTPDQEGGRIQGFSRGALVGQAMSAYGGRGHDSSEPESGSSRGRKSDEREAGAESLQSADRQVPPPDMSVMVQAQQPPAEVAPPPLIAPPAPPVPLAPPPSELADVQFMGRPPDAQTENASISIHHPDLGPIQLEVHREQGRVEVHAILESVHAEAVLRANEQGIRQGVQQSGMTFSALRVRVRGDDAATTRGQLQRPQQRRRRGNERET